MTAKRFSYKFGKHMILEYNFYDKSKKLTFNDVVVLLNEQHETIHRLKQNIDELKRRNKKLEKHLRRFYSNEEWELKKALGDFE